LALFDRGPEPEVYRRPPDDLIARVARHLEEAVVHVYVAGFGKRRDGDRAGARAEGFGETVFRSAPPLFERHALGHVGDGHDRERDAARLVAHGRAAVAPVEGEPRVAASEVKLVSAEALAAQHARERP